MIRSFRSRALKRFWTKSDASGLRPEWARKVERQLALLDQALQPSDMDVVTFGFHALTGDLRGRFSVTVSKNWRLTFAFDGQDAVDVDLEDYPWQVAATGNDLRSTPARSCARMCCPVSA